MKLKNIKTDLQKFRVIVVLFFVTITFLLTWIFSYGSISGYPLPLGMLVPATVAIIFQYLFPKDNKVISNGDNKKSQWIGYSFILLSAFQISLLISSSVLDLSKGVVQSIGNILFVLWALVIIQIFKSKANVPIADHFALGNTKMGIVFVIGVTIFMLGQSGLNLIFGLGEFQGIKSSINGIQIPVNIYPIAFVSFLLLAIIGGPLGSLATTFGEEYGWRGFLQRELFILGPRISALIVGIIWGLWHIPIIKSGVHTYPPTILGYSLAFIFFILWGYIQSYAVIKTKSIWVAAFLHGLVNNVYAFSLNYIVRPDNKLFSFGLGTYGLICLAIVVAVVLKDPAWNSQPID